jgi:hypothetical protein
MSRSVGLKALTLNQRVQGSSPCAPTIEKQWLRVYGSHALLEHARRAHATKSETTWGNVWKLRAANRKQLGPLNKPSIAPLASAQPSQVLLSRDEMMSL